MRLKIIFTLLIVLALAAAASAQTKFSGTLQCGKPDQQQAIEVGDRPNHSFVIYQLKCTWTNPSKLREFKARSTSLQALVKSAAIARMAKIMLWAP